MNKNIFENLNPECKRVLDSKTALLNGFSTESKQKILKIAETGNVNVLKQEIDFLNLGGDY